MPADSSTSPRLASHLDALRALVPDPARYDAVRAVLDDALAEVERETRERLQRAERLTHAGQLAAGVAHELRNPLTVIETSVFLLKERASGQGDAVVDRHLRRIVDQVAIASGIVGDLLDTARERPMHPAPVDLSALIHDAVAWVPRDPDVAVALDLPTSPATVPGDARRLRQVIINLVSNALHAMSTRPRAPRLEVSLRRDGDAVELAVRDHGVGIHRDDLPRVFEPLFSTRHEGVGLGLALSREIAEAHGGTLSAENAPDGGARFTLRLPAA